MPVRRSVGTTLIASLASAVVALGLGVGGAPAADAATDLTMPVSATAVGTEINAASELLHNDTKGDTAATGYQIGYRGTMTMTGIWANYNLLKSAYKVLGGHSEAQWDALKLTGSWTIEFTVDPAYVALNPSFLTVAGLQAQYEQENSGTAFPQYMRVTGVDYNATTGRYLATYALQDGGVNEVSAGKIDDAQPATLTLTTPEQALYVKESDFVPGRTIVMTNPKVSGTLNVTTLFVAQLPVTFNGTGEPVTITMVPTYRGSFSYVSATAGHTLPNEVMSQVPDPRRNLANGTEVTPPAPGSPSVVVADGTWDFVGWDPAAATIDGADESFVGSWVFTPKTVEPTPTPTPTPTESESPTPTVTPTVTPTESDTETTPTEQPPVPPSTSATAVTGTPNPEAELPDTGSPAALGAWTVLGGLAVAGGVVALLAGRRMRRLSRH